MNARQAAFVALKGVSRGAYSSIAIGKTLSDNDVSERDRALAGAIFYGVLEREAELDAMLAPLLSRPLSKLEKDVLIILRMGLYQIAFMDKVPESAAVNESVTLARVFGYKKASGLVNAVLRGYIRKNKTAENGGSGDNAGGATGEDTSVKPGKKDTPAMTVPGWLRGLWEKDYGAPVTEKITASLAGKPPLYVRINTLLSREGGTADMDGIELRGIEWLDAAAEVVSRGGITSTAAYRYGLLYTQDISSQLCCAMTGVREGDNVLDVCAAPGGKSFTIAQLMNGRGSITACDIHSHRVALIEKGAARLEIDIIKAVRRDALDTERSGGELYDAVLCDVPCSGLGVIRRKPDILKKTPEEIAPLPELQYAILEASSKKVKPGGVLMYSTCTLRRAENGDIVERFLMAHPEFSGEPLVLPKNDLRVIEEPAHELTLFPHAAGSDGFFMAKMRRN